MKFAKKVEKFVECIRATESAYDARMMAFTRFDLNASAPSDEAAWWQAVEECGHPYKNEE